MAEMRGWPDRVRTVFVATMFAIALAGFAVSAFLHFSTYTDFFAVRRFGECTFLHAAMFVPFLGALAFFARRKKLLGASASWKELFPFGCPGWLQLATGCVCLYAAVNFVLFVATNEGLPRRTDDTPTKYALMDRSVIRRGIGEDEYHRRREQHLRGMSGHWMAFFLVPAVAFGVYLFRGGRDGRRTLEVP